MMGGGENDDENYGIIPRVFHQISKSKSCFKISFLEIYQEQVR
jgi:hypothetical protein